jgi:acyl-coenzyme A thioesterase PaaI-like protein
MFDIQKIIEKAKTSSFSLWLLNFGLNRMVPFNRPHGFKIVKLTDESIETKLPFKTLNFNHIRSVHACALATLTEFSTGVFLISKFSPKSYRIILRNLHMEYHYQGKTGVFGKFGLSETEMQEKVFIPLKNEESVDLLCEVKTYDLNNNHISTGKVTWQIKEWAKVRTSV